MRYPPDLLDEIRARLPVSAVVGRKVRLKRAGREWKALSPFNAEKTPSFTVNDQKGFYHCFSSGKHGDVFTFLMETEGLSFPEAVERLAAEAGVPLPQASPGERRDEDRRRSLYEVMELAAAFFESRLQDRPGRAARDYLAGRGLREEAQRRFRMGYAPGDRHALRDHLAGRDVPVGTMVELGLLVSGEDVAVPYDRFRDRIMFPIADVKGRVVAFGGRALAPDVPAKYLNSPDTPLFHKGRTLYNLDRARKAAHERGTVIAVEGYLDVVAMTEAGFPNAVAPLGTALTEEQLALLWRLAAEPILCFDGDPAGRRAAYRALELALPLLETGRALRFALLPEGQDPDDLVRSGEVGILERVIGSARPLVDLLWAREMEAGPLDTPEQQAALERRLREAVAQIRDETLRRYYREDIESRLASRLQTHPGPRRSPFGRDGRGTRAFPAPAGTRLPPGYRPSPVLTRSLSAAAGRVGGGPDHGGAGGREALIIALVLAHPHLLHGHTEILADLEVSGRNGQRIRDALLDCAAHEELDPALVASRLERAGLGPAAAELKQAVRPGDRLLLEESADPARVEGALRQAITLHRKARTLNTELRAAQRALAEDQSETNLAWLCQVRDQMLSLEGAEADLEGSGV